MSLKRVAFGIGLAGLIFHSLGAVPTLPNINTNNIITATNVPYGALGDGVTDNTLAFSNAIMAAASGTVTNGLLGGTVRVPGPGVYLSGPLTFRANVNFEIDAGATLLMQPLAVWTNYPAQNQVYGNLFYASGVTNLEISGAGTIDGRGSNWWSAASSVFNNRPYMIFFNGNCRRVLIRDVTIQNPPKMHIVFKGTDNDITIKGITINTTASNAANTDGIDLVGTNCLVTDCTINAGDDNIALGSSSASAITVGVTITNCAFGKGHGVSIGSNTAGAVSNLTVVNCTFNGTDYGIRMKSNDATSGGSGQGGIAQNLNYYNLNMTNIVDGAVVIYSYYASGGQFGTPTGVSPLFASTQAVDVTTIPVWRDITISNVTATVSSGGVPGIIWARMEVPATNVVFNHVNISGSQPFEVYSAKGVQFIDCQITPPARSNTFLVYNSSITVSNSAPSTNLITFDGLSTNGYHSSLALYNAQAALRNTNVFDSGPLTLGSSTLVVSNHLTFPPSFAGNFVLGSGPSTITVLSNLSLSGAINLSSGPGFNSNNYTLFNYGGSLNWGPPTLSGNPGGLQYRLSTNVPGQVQAVLPFLTVSNLNDSGPGSLRQQLTSAHDGDTISFDPGVTGTITLTNGKLALSNSVTIIGPGAALLALKGNNDRVLFVGAGTSTISGLCFTNGKSPGTSSAGGIYVALGAGLVLSNCLVVGNSSALEGGGIGNFGTLDVWNSLIENNAVLDSAGGSVSGGGVWNEIATATFRNCTISSNVVRSTFSGAGVAGGGVYNIGGTCSFWNCTICSNLIATPPGGPGSLIGGGIANQSGTPKGIINLTNCTIAYNQISGGISANQFGGGLASSTMNVAGSIVAKNTAGTGPDVYAAANSGGYNLIGIGDLPTTGFTNGVQHDQVGTAASPLDPRLAGLQSNGGPTPTIELLSGSPAIDQGNSFGFSSDQRGAPRPFHFPGITNAAGGDGSDVGAFESGIPILNLTPQSGMVLLSWKSYYGDFALETSTNLRQANGWSAWLGMLPAIVGDQLSVTDAVSSTSVLYRLKSRY